MFRVVLTLTSTLTHYFTSNHDKFISMSTIYCYRSNTLKFRSMKNNSAFNKSIQLPEGLSTVRNIKHRDGNQDNLSFITFQIWLISVFKEFSEADQCRTLEFRPEKEFDGKRLVNHVIRIVEVTVRKFCETMCYMEPDCVSINLDKRAGGRGVYRCELNNVTHEGHEDELTNNASYFYHAAEVCPYFNKIFAAPKHSSTTIHQCTTFSFWFLPD